MEALALLARQAGLAPAIHGGEAAGLLARLPRLTNLGMTLRPSAQIPRVARQVVRPRLERSVAPPLFTNGRPGCFPERSGVEVSPALELLEVPDGRLAMLGRAPVVLADALTVVADFSSPYAGLVHGYAVDLERLFEDALEVAGAAIVLCSDIHPANFCHWLVDELPRLAALGERRDVTLLVSDEGAPFRDECMRLCGFAPERVVAVGDFQAVRAERLLLTADLADMPHPGFKAAPWLLDFLRARIGFAALAGQAPYAFPRKLFVSRDDALGRRILNESELMGVLGPAGYERVTLAGRSVAEQVSLFCRATHVIGAHGAGLANIVFAPAGGRLLEILPASYGTPTYYVLAAGQGLGYATYVAHDLAAGDRPQTDDIRLDVEDFRARCGGLL